MIFDPPTDYPGGGPWPTSENFTVQARIDAEFEAKNVIRNTQPAFEILEAQVLVFDHTVIPSAQRAFENVWPGVPITKYRNSSAYQVLHPGSVSFGSTSEQWVVFFESWFAPGTFPVHFRVLCEGADAFGLVDSGLQVPNFGTMPAQNGYDASKPGYSRYWDEQRLGAFFLHTISGSSASVALQAKDGQNEPGIFPTSWAVRFRWFAVRLNTFSNVIAYDRANLNAPRIRFPSTGAVKSWKIRREFTLGNWADYVVLATATRRSPAGAASFEMDVTTGGGSSSEESDNYLHRGVPVAARTEEGCPLVAVGVQKDFAPNQQIVVHLSKHPNEPLSGRQDFGDNAALVGFYFETDPETGGYADETPGPDLVIVPGKEVDAGACGAGLDAEVIIYADQKLLDQFRAISEELRFVLITSEVKLALLQDTNSAQAIKLANGTIAIEASPSEHAKCVRCWHHRVEVGQNDSHPQLCGRCIDNIDGDGEKRLYA